MSRRVLSIDLESYSDVDLVNCGVYRYVEGDFHILLFAYAFDDEDVQCVDLACGEKLPQEVIDAIFDDSIIKSAWNAQFERTCLSKYFGTQLSPDSWQCTMVWAASLSLPLKLKLAAQVLKTGEQKDDAGERLIRYFSIPCKATKSNGGRTRNLPEHAPDDWKLFKSYCIQDVKTERDIRLRLERFPLPTQEWNYYHMDQRINDRGVLIDKNLVQQAIICDMLLSEEMTKRAYELTGLENPNSVSQLKSWLEERGISVDSLGKKDVSALIADLDKHSIDSEALDMMKLRLQMAKSSVKKYQAAERCICDDGRAHGLFQFYGANRTGRFAGRLLQLQNLPQNHISTLDEARELVKMGCFDMVESIYGNTPDILSQLIRTMLIPKDGCEFIVADFSAIEARVLAWLSGEQWVLDAFRNGEDLYCATASQMFGVPVVKHGINGELRQKGKISTLACGYGGSVGALISMGALDMGLKENELPDIITSWREANPHTVQFWYAVEKAAIDTVKDHTDRTVGHIGFQFSANTLWIVLPSGRRLAYIKPKLQPNRFGRMALTFEGLGTNNKWVRQETYSGKLVENCIAKGTLVLTHLGLIPIENIKTEDLIWDGVEWVHHEGLIYKGMQKTVEVMSGGKHGIHMTPQHKILTQNGWVMCSEANGLNWADVSLPDGYTEGREYKIWENSMVMPMRMRKRSSGRCRRFKKEKISNKILRLYEQKVNQRCPDAAWNVKTSCLGRMALNETTLSRSKSPGIPQLWGQRYNGLRTLARKFREFLARYGINLAKRAGYRQNRQQQGIQSGKLQVDNQKSQLPKQTQQSDNNYFTWYDDCSRISRKNRHWRNNIAIQNCKRLDGRLLVNPTGCKECVYDIRNCGSRHRFTVWDTSACRLRIVSNCTQATARDILVEAMKRIEDAGLDIVGHVHDEVILEVPKGKYTVDDVCGIMNQNPKWAEGLPLESDGYTGTYYFKS